jgi:hypothetical protein
MRQPHRRRRHVEQVILLGQCLDDDAESIEIAFENRLLERCPSQLQATRTKIVHGGNCFDGDLALGELLDVAKESMLTCLGEGDGHAFTAGATGAANAMDISIGRRRHVVVDDMRHMLDVQASSGHVGRDEEVRRAVAEAPHDAIALLLRQPAVQRLGAIATSAEGLRQLVHLGPCPAKHDR